MKGHRGYSLMEILVVVGVVAIATVAIVQTFKTVSINAQVDKTAVALSELIDVVEKGWGNLQSYNGLTSSIAASRRLVPDVLRSDQGITSPWGEVVLGHGGDLRDQIRIEMTVPGSACFKLVHAIAPMMKRIEVQPLNGGAGTVVLTGGVLDDAATGQACRGNARLVMYRYKDGLGRRAMWETW